jgi:hypothetical protein
MTDPNQKQLSRRDAIKLLGAAAGASVLANLPTKWTTPQLAAGVLPAHAQTSAPAPSIGDWACSADEDIFTGSGITRNFMITVVPPGATVFYLVRLNNNSSCVQNVSVFGVPAVISGSNGPSGSVVSDGITGIATVPVQFDFTCPGGTIRCEFDAGGVQETFLCEQSFNSISD